MDTPAQATAEEIAKARAAISAQLGGSWRAGARAGVEIAASMAENLSAELAGKPEFAIAVEVLDGYVEALRRENTQSL